MGGLSGFFRKKLQSSSLTEVIVATTILLLVFGIALATMQAILKGSLQKNTMVIEGRMNRLMYQYENGQLNAPDVIDSNHWTIRIQKPPKDSIQYIVFEAIHKHSKKRVIKKLIAAEE